MTTDFPDGVLDVVGRANQKDFPAGNNQGAIYVWAGGPGLAGAQAPRAVLTSSTAVAGGELGNLMPGHGILAADLTGDGGLDLLVGTSLADVGGVYDAGALYFWQGPSRTTPRRNSRSRSRGVLTEAARTRVRFAVAHRPIRS
jgi:hypothetical protein